jgi:transposase-like protein
VIARIREAHEALAARGVVAIADWADAVGVCRATLYEWRRHYPELRALPVRGRGRPRKSDRRDDPDVPAPE